MVGKTKHRTNADNERLDILSAYCLPCMISGWRWPLGTIQHVTEGGRRLQDQHQKTYPACVWHHLGVLPRSYPAIDHCSREMGPSFAHHKTAYRERYGSERQLIAVADELVRETLESRRRGEFIPDDRARQIVRDSHRSIVK